jgi:hypothetical protein
MTSDTMTASFLSLRSAASFAASYALNYCFRVFKAKLRSKIKNAKLRGDYILLLHLKHKNLGFFASLTVALRAVQYANMNNMSLKISIENENYEDKNGCSSNFLSSYFDSTIFDKGMSGNISTVAVSNLNSLWKLPLYKEPMLTLVEASEIAKKYFLPKSEVMLAADNYISSSLSRSFIAVHWRGTDKSREAPPVAVNDYFSKLMPILATYPKDTLVFLATDDKQHLASFLDKAEQLGLINRIRYREGLGRSLDGSPCHLSKVPGKPIGRDKGLDALVDSLILSKATCLIRNVSLLSAWSVIFNPNLRVITLNRPYIGCRWFPETALVDT